MSKIFEANFRPTNVSREHQIRSSDVLGFSGFDDEQRIGVDVKLQYAELRFPVGFSLKNVRIKVRIELVDDE